MNLQRVHQFCVARDLVEETERSIREAGREGYERFVLWSGRVSATTFEVSTLHVPKQTSYRLKRGLCVRVEGNELHHLNLWLFEREEGLGVQIHGHPGEAYHSETDDAYPIVTALGGLSIVVPDFCKRSLFGPGTMTYRLSPNGWRMVRSEAARQLIAVA